MNQVMKDGFVINSDTGEIIEHAEVKADWSPETEEDVEYLLGLIQELEASALGARARIRAITENLEGMARDAERKREWLLHRYGAVLEAFTASRLKDEEGHWKGPKSIKTAFGTLGFRRTVGSISVNDKDEAVAWAAENAPKAVKVVHEVQVSALKGLEGELPPCFDITWPEDKFYVNTGVK